MPEPVPSYSVKPIPQDVLRILSDRIEFEKFMEVENNAESWPLLTPESIKSSEGCGDLVDDRIANLENSSHLPSKYLKASDKIGSLLLLDSVFQNADAAETNESDAADQLQVSVSMEPSSAKVRTMFSQLGEQKFTHTVHSLIFRFVLIMTPYNNSYLVCELFIFMD